MDENQSQPVRKRKNSDVDGDNDQLVKRQKSDSDQNQPSIKEITGINNDCLQVIFEYLGFKDLFNVAVANGNLSVAAGLVFKRKFGHEMIEFNRRNIIMRKDNGALNDDVIEVTPETDHKAFLDIFDVYLQKLSVNLDNEQYKSIEDLILENCAEPLTELSLNEPDHPWIQPELEDVFKNIQKPLANVKKLDLNRCHLSKNGSRLSTWFPELRHLSLYDVKFADSDDFIARYPLLEHFGIGAWTDGYTLTRPQILDLLKLNPQIRSLDITLAANGDELDFYQQINEILPDLEQLQLCWEANSFRNHKENRITFKRLQKLALNFSVNSFSGFRNLPFDSDQLTELEINNVPVLTNEWMKFILQHESLTKLTLVPFNQGEMYFFARPNNQDLLRLAKGLPKLNTLVVDVTEITTNCILQFITACDSIDEIQIIWNERCGFNSFHHGYLKRGAMVLDRIRDGWKILRENTNSIILKRKIHLN